MIEKIHGNVLLNIYYHIFGYWGLPLGTIDFYKPQVKGCHQYIMMSKKQGFPCFTNQFSMGFPGQQDGVASGKLRVCYAKLRYFKGKIWQINQLNGPWFPASKLFYVKLVLNLEVNTPVEQ
jgi:hypothetical protein